MLKKEQKEVIKTYKKMYQIHGPSAKALAWRDRLSQEVRFQTFLEIVDDPQTFNQKKILDIGSGLGDFYFYLQKKKINCDYTGIDLVDDFISYSQKNYQEAKFILGDYLESKLGSFDYIFSSGLFSFPLEDNFEFLKEVVKKMMIEARLAIAFNFLTTFHNQKETGLYYFHPSDVLKIILENQNIFAATMRMDYELVHNLNDATIYLFKSKV